jgi:hypothetical protein
MTDPSSTALDKLLANRSTVFEATLLTVASMDAWDYRDSAFAILGAIEQMEASIQKSLTKLSDA